MSLKAPFDAIAGEYDLGFSDTYCGRVQRARVHALLRPWLPTPGKALEINCGTGIDALWLAEAGWQVWATDISAAMVQATREKAERSAWSQAITCIQADAAHLQGAFAHQQFDVLLSDFGGLNCLSPQQLTDFGRDAAQLVRPGGLLAVVIMGRFCAWETLYFLAKRQWKQAFRRWHTGPVEASLGHGASVPVWYYSPKKMARSAPDFTPVGLTGVGIWAPPSYLEPLMQRWKPLRDLATWAEQRSTSPKWAALSDHYLLLLRRNAVR